MNDDDFIAPPCVHDIDVLFDDGKLLVINKPSGLLSLSGKNPLNKDSVHYRLVQQYPTVTLAHRLDFGTSGLMVLALNKSVNAQLTKQFQDRSIVKKYSAILYGHLAADAGLIDLPISRACFPHQKICYETGKQAQSEYQVTDRTLDERSGAKTTRVIYTPKTGRTHQLRIHSREIGHPIIGCDLYCSKIDGVDTVKLSDRLCLHAGDLTFSHPLNDERMTFNSPCEF